VALLGYESTASGKSYTLPGPSTEAYSSFGELSDNAGLVPRAIQMLLQTSKALESEGWTYALRLSLQEVNRDSVNDLLAEEPSDDAPHKSNLDIKHGQDPGPTAVVINLQSCEQAFALLDRAKKRRKADNTRANECSSQSNTFYTLRVQGTHLERGMTRPAVLRLIDAMFLTVSLDKVSSQETLEVLRFGHSLQKISTIPKARTHQANR
ncbi:kinesin-like nuclear fusion protein, partial [Tilletia horrida]